MLEICCSYKIISLSNLIIHMPGTKTYTRHQQVLLTRLERLLTVGENPDLTYPPEIMKGMVRKSIFATLRECGNYEIREGALEMIRRYAPRPDRNEYVQ